jgi:flagellar P-ring protein FlgI
MDLAMRNGFVALALAAGLVMPASAQQVRVADVASPEGSVPVRLVGYGIVVGLDGTGDRSLGSATAGSTHTVRSVANMLARFGVHVPEDRLRTRNVAAVVVTAEVGAGARPGARFDVHVSSLGDATSLDGGVLWMTPLVAEAEGEVYATAQGAIGRGTETGRTTMRLRAGSALLASGGLVEARLPGGATAPERLVLNSPDLATAARISGVINGAHGDGTARVEDASSVRLEMAGQAEPMLFLAGILEMPLEVSGASRLVVDSRNGSVIAGGDIRVGPASISYGDIALTVGAAPPDPLAQAPGAARVAPNASVHDVVAALRTAGARPSEVAHILLSLQRAGAIRAEVIVR